jgi:hypothetical protein
MAARMRAEAHVGGPGHPPAPDELAAQAVQPDETGGTDPRDK